jgi:hypothetical protein
MDETPSASNEAWKAKVHSVDERLRALREPVPVKQPKNRKRVEKKPKPGLLPPILENPL